VRHRDRQPRERSGAVAERTLLRRPDAELTMQTQSRSSRSRGVAQRGRQRVLHGFADHAGDPRAPEITTALLPPRVDIALVVLEVARERVMALLVAQHVVEGRWPQAIAPSATRRSVPRSAWAEDLVEVRVVRQLIALSAFESCACGVAA
jgi:hypothetical protein